MVSIGDRLQSLANSPWAAGRTWQYEVQREIQLNFQPSVFGNAIGSPTIAHIQPETFYESRSIDSAIGRSSSLPLNEQKFRDIDIGMHTHNLHLTIARFVCCGAKRNCQTAPAYFYCCALTRASHTACAMPADCIMAERVRTERVHTLHALYRHPESSQLKF